MSKIRFLEQNTDSAVREPAIDWGPGLAPAAMDDLGGFTLYRAERENRQPGDYNVLISQRAFRAIWKHLSTDTSREQGGLLLGYSVIPEDGGPPTVVIVGSFPAKHSEGNAVRVAFLKETWDQWDEVQKTISDSGIHLERVGWYHSHPNIKIFLSSYDLDVCKTFNRKPYPVALVIDPVQNRAGFFIRSANGEYQPYSPQGYWQIGVDGETVPSVINMEPATLASDPAAPSLSDSSLNQQAEATSPETAPPAESSSTPVTPAAVLPNREKQGIPKYLPWAAAALLLFGAVLIGAVLVQVNSLDKSVQQLSERVTSLPSAMSTVHPAPPAGNTSPGATTPTVTPPPTTTPSASQPERTAKPEATKPAQTNAKVAKSKSVPPPKPAPAKPKQEAPKPATSNAGNANGGAASDQTGTPTPVNPSPPKQEPTTNPAPTPSTPQALRRESPQPVQLWAGMRVANRG